MADDTKRGLGSPNMDEGTKEEIQSKGGQASPGNFANDSQKASEAGRKGGQASRDNQEDEEGA